MCVSLSLFDLLNLLVADNGCNWMSLVCRAHTIYLFHRQIFLLCSLMLLSLHRKGKFRWKIKMHQRRVNTPRILVRNRKKIPLRLRQNNQTQIIPCHTQETYIVFYPTTESLCTWLNPCSLCRIAENTAAECTPRTYNIIYIILVYVWWFSIMIPTQRMAAARPVWRECEECWLCVHHRHRHRGHQTGKSGTKTFRRRT